MSEFQRFGQAVPFGETEVELADVRPIHDITARELFLAARSPKVSWNEDLGYDETQYSLYFRSMDENELDFPDRFVSVRLAHNEVPDNWQLAVNVRSYVPAERNSNKRICYRFAAVEDELLQAKKEVFFVRGRSRIVFDDNNEPLEIVDTVRKAYERQMNAEDCGDLLELLSRSVKRAKIARK